MLLQHFTVHGAFLMTFGADYQHVTQNEKSLRIFAPKSSLVKKSARICKLNTLISLNNPIFTSLWLQGETKDEIGFFGSWISRYLAKQRD